MSKPPSKYPSHCRMQHAGWIGYNHNDWPNDERCPVCRLQDELAAAEDKLAAYESQARAQGDTILDLNAKLADEVRLADALLRELNRRQDASFSLTTDDVIADYEAARQAGKAVEREEGKR